MDRIIGSFEGSAPGPLVIAIAAMHGNEPAGVEALKEAFRMLQTLQHPGFRGRFTGMIGNLAAYKNKRRFMNEDLNRMWLKENTRTILNHGESTLEGEAIEFYRLYHLLCAEIETSQASRLYLLDLHTTSAGGGNFSIPTDEKESLQWAKALEAPVILNLFERVEGTLLRFTVDGGFQPAGRKLETSGVAYEAGRHDDPSSVTRSLSAIFSTLKFAGCIPAAHLKIEAKPDSENAHSSLPSVTRLIHVHHINQGDEFIMKPGYVNFQPVRAGEHLADDVRGPVTAPASGLILMPLYQPQGSDGFFLVKEETED